MTETKPCMCGGSGLATLGSTNSLFCSACNNDGSKPIPAHPDTARADEAERMLWRVLERCRSGQTITGIGAVYGDISGLRKWHDANYDRVKAIVKRADLEDQRNQLRKQLAVTEAELAKLTEEKS